MSSDPNASNDIRQSGLWGNYLEELGWVSHKLTSTSFAYSKKVPLIGTIMKIPRIALPIPLKQIEDLTKKIDPFFTKLEPSIQTNEKNLEKILALLKNSGFAKDNWSLSPTKTIQIDLKKSEDELLKNMEKDTRYNVRLAQRRGVEVKQTDDFEQFKTIYYATAKRKGFWAAKKELETVWKIFSKNKSASILSAYHNDEILASTLLLYHEGKGYYYHAASAESRRELMAPYLLLWQSIRYLKKKGYRVMDLEGTYDPRNPVTKKWKGFTLFKKGFGGEEIEYVGSFVKYHKLWAKLLFLPSRFF